jgi:hypothetical protein
MIRFLHVPLILGWAAMLAFQLPDEVLAPAGIAVLLFSIGVEATLALVGYDTASDSALNLPNITPCGHDWVFRGADSEFDYWGCERCDAKCRTPRGCDE